MYDDRPGFEQEDDPEEFIQSLIELEQKAKRIAAFRFGSDEGRVAMYMAAAAQRAAEETRRDMEEKTRMSLGEKMNGDKLITMLDGEPFDLQIRMLRDYADLIEIDETFLHDLVFELDDAELLKHVLEHYCSGVSVTEEFIQQVNDSFRNEDLLKLALKMLYSGQNVSEAFLRDLIVDYDDEHLLRYVLDNHFADEFVSTEFIHEIVLWFKSTALTEYVIRNYY